MGEVKENASRGRAVQAPEPTTAVLAPSASFRRRIADALARDGIEVIVNAAAVADLEGGCSTARPDVLILAFEEGCGARRAVSDLRRTFPDARVVLLTSAAGARAMPGLESQIDGIVYSSQLQAALPPTVRAVLAEQVVFPRNGRRRTDSPPLSHRERQVLRLAVTGQTNAQIAAKIYLSTSTVKSHLTSAFAKLGVRSRSEAAALLLNPAEPASHVVFARPQAHSPNMGAREARR
jgi:DNA-binding NarL/FixJ family response regulator